MEKNEKHLYENDCGEKLTIFDIVERIKNISIYSKEFEDIGFTNQMIRFGIPEEQILKLKYENLKKHMDEIMFELYWIDHDKHLQTKTYFQLDDEGE